MAKSGRTVVRFRQNQHPERGALLAAGYIYDKRYEYACRQRVLEEFAIVFLLDGGGFYEDELVGHRALKQGDALLLFPGVEHSYGCGRDQTWSECFLVFQSGIFAQLEREGLIDRRQPILSPGSAPEVISAFSDIIRDYQRAQRGSDAQFVARIHLLVADMVERHRRHLGGDNHDHMALARALLEEQVHRPLDLEQLARRLGMSYETFRKWFSREAGVAPAQYRALRRIDEAKRLLIADELTLAEISERLGYCDQYFFARQFKQLAKQTPGAFRRGFLARSREST